jgi:hypothetical protein
LVGWLTYRLVDTEVILSNTSSTRWTDAVSGKERGSRLSSLQVHGSLGVDVPVDEVVDRRSRRPWRGRLPASFDPPPRRRRFHTGKQGVSLGRKGSGSGKRKERKKRGSDVCNSHPSGKTSSTLRARWRIARWSAAWLAHSVEHLVCMRLIKEAQLGNSHATGSDPAGDEHGTKAGFRD